MPRKPVLQSRLACDRCHSQKLRCPRQDNYKTTKDETSKQPAPCVRCERAKVACVFSPRQRRTVIPKLAGASKPPPPPNHDIANNADTTPASTGPALTQTAPTVVENGNVNSVEVESASCTLENPLPTTTATPTDTQLLNVTDLDQDFYGSSYFDNNQFHLQQPSSGSCSNPSTTCTDLCPLSLDTTTAIDWDNILLCDPLLPPSRGWSLLDIDKSLLPPPAPDPFSPPHGPPLPLNLMSSTSSSDIDPILFHPSANPSVDYSNPQALTPYSPVRQLANLNVSLYEHLCLIPQIYSNCGLPPLTPVVRIDVLEKRLLAIDHTFQLTQELIDIVGKLYPRSGPGVLSGDDAPDAPKTGTGVPLGQDQATILLLLSCAQRVCDVYDLSLSHMRKCLKKNSVPHFDEELKPVRLPPFRVSAVCAPPTDRAVALHMCMVMMMASNLFDQLQEVLGLWRHSSGQEQHSELEVQVDLQYPDFGREAKEKMGKKARDVAMEIVTIRQIIVSFSGLGMEDTRQAVLELESGGGGGGVRKAIGEVRRLALEGCCSQNLGEECY
ncbi:uncharacterized protein B0T23DRAFT_130697 [Neurospora hispaniola]|uniref:Zn(2)-C6 fungal-type domain-containing protein n=1 Tax=Neurospora hispaniola TaxID=588809 RepID=A0AAJ0MT16_9PEZI|nr:hypothetical protein B0T23DRAFT_130697 [Neurospora hispaniola]